MMTTRFSVSPRSRADLESSFLKLLPRPASRLGDRLFHSIGELCTPSTEPSADLRPARSCRRMTRCPDSAIPIDFLLPGRRQILDFLRLFEIFYFRFQSQIRKQKSEMPTARQHSDTISERSNTIKHNNVSASIQTQMTSLQVFTNQNAKVFQNKKTQ